MRRPRVLGALVALAAPGPNDTERDVAGVIESEAEVADVSYEERR